MNTFDQDGLTYHNPTLKTRNDMSDEAYEELYDFIMHDMKEKDAREWLAAIANIFQGSEPAAEKYANISDCFEKIIDRLAQSKWEDLTND
jgi:hypothetical protein